MIVSGHQPVYLPWLGLFHKLYLCDAFVYMDTVQYLEQDWQNRNKIRTPHGEMWLTIPIDRTRTAGKMTDQIYIKQTDWQEKHWKALLSNYKKTRYWSEYSGPLSHMYLETRWDKLVDLCWEQFSLISEWLGMKRTIVRLSERQCSGEKDELVLDHCLQLGADQVVFGAMGKNYVRPEIFLQRGIKPCFQDYQHPVYAQRFQGFRPNMTVLDLLFNHGPDSLDILLSGNVSKDSLRRGDLPGRIE